MTAAVFIIAACAFFVAFDQWANVCISRIGGALGFYAFMALPMAAFAFCVYMAITTS